MTGTMDDVGGMAGGEAVAGVATEPAGMLKRVAGKSATYLGGDVLIRGAAFLLIPVYTHYLSPSDYGLVASVQVFVGVVGLLYGMGLEASVTRMDILYSDDEGRRRTFLCTVLVLLFVVGIALSAILYAAGGWLSSSLFEGVPFHPYLELGIGWAFLATLPAVVPTTVYLARHQANRYVGFQALGFALTALPSVYLVVVASRGALGLLQGQVLGSALLCVIGLTITLRMARPRVSVAEARSALGYGLPLIPHEGANWVLAMSDRLIIMHYVGLSAVGIYSIGYKLGEIAAVMFGAVNRAWVPFFYDTADHASVDAPHAFARLSTVYAVFLATVVLALSAFATPIVGIIAPPSFAAAATVVPWIALASGFRGAYYLVVTPLFHRMKTWVIPVLSAIAAAVNIGVNLVVIPRYGLMGAAYSTALAYGLLAGLALVVAQRTYPIPYEWARVGLVFGSAAAVYALVQLTGSGWAAGMVRAALLAAFAGGWVLVLRRRLAPVRRREEAAIA